MPRNTSQSPSPRQQSKHPDCVGAAPQVAYGSASVVPGPLVLDTVAPMVRSSVVSSPVVVEVVVRASVVVVVAEVVTGAPEVEVEVEVESESGPVASRPGVVVPVELALTLPLVDRPEGGASEKQAAATRSSRNGERRSMANPSTRSPGPAIGEPRSAM
ncbi:hypothetical protein [Nannocystis pusilla]|uniref:hypothetical protein n=1 Tax=Nannocystis pusilla TaxID=889268 RepID=UPI003DA5193F